jgi:hypothetical protein
MSSVAYQDGSGAGLRRVSLATMATGAAALLIYVSGSFIVTELLGIKRVAEAILIVPVAIASAVYFARRPARMLDPLVGFVLVKTAIEAAFRHEWIWLFDDLATLMAIMVILSAPRRSVEAGARVIVLVAATFAAMALAQWVMLFLFPGLGVYRLIVGEDDVLINTVGHPIALLGLFSEQQYQLLGQDVARLQSFAKEPSLNVVYFLLPACLAFLLEVRWAVLAVGAIVCFCALSLSGSIFLSFGFTALWLLLMALFSVRNAFAFGLPAFVVLYIYVLKAFGLEPLFQGITYVAQYGDFLNKGESLTNRGTQASVNADSVLSLPLGSPEHPDLPGPWLVNGTLEAGWLGGLLLLWFLRNLAIELDQFNAGAPYLSWRRSGVLLLLGTMSTIVVFNDYQMSNYAGLTLVAFIYRMLCLKNEARPGYSGIVAPTRP